MYPSICFIMYMRACKRTTRTLKKEKVHEMEMKIQIQHIFNIYVAIIMQFVNDEICTIHSVHNEIFN